MLVYYGLCGQRLCRYSSGHQSSDHFNQDGRAKTDTKDPGGGKDLSEKILPGLVDILSATGDRMEDYQKHGVPITDEDLKEIDKL